MARRRSGKKIDFTHWSGFSAAALTMSAGSVGVLAVSAQHLPETLLRTRGNLVSWLDGAQAPGTTVSVSCGLILVPEGTGSTVLWSPQTDADAPWFWFERFFLGYDEGVVDTIACDGICSFRSVVDSKAMRIIKNMEIQFVVEQSTTGLASDINTVLGGRFLAGT